jgi:hypothetical protein
MPRKTEHDPDDDWPVTASNWGHLVARVGTLEGSLRAVAAGHVQLTEQMSEITINQRRGEAQRAEQTQRLDDITAELAKNSKTTSEILTATLDLRDVVITAKTGGKFARWLAPTVVAVAAALAVFKGWWTAAVDWFAR